MDFGRRLKSLRLERDLSQKELANIINVSHTNISKYESNSVEPNIELINKLANYFDVSTDYLLGRTIVRKPVDTIAFHSLDDDDLTEEGKEELAKLKELLKLKYGKKD